MSNKTPALTKCTSMGIWVVGASNQLFIEEVLELKQNLQKNKVVPGKTPLFLICPFCTHHFIRFNIVFCMEMMPFQS